MTTAVLVASGPSLTIEQTQMVEAARAAGKCHVVVVNRNWELLPNADVLYAADAKWWKQYIGAVRAGFSGECWTQHKDAAKEYGLCHVQSKGLPGLSRDAALIHTGQNSGYQAINLAYHFGARQIVLIGYDMMREGGKKQGRAHWHDDYPRGMGNAANPQAWAGHFTKLAADLGHEGVRIVNCSIVTALTLPRADLAETLAAL